MRSPHVPYRVPWSAMTRRLLLVSVALVTVACGGRGDRSMATPQSGPQAPTTTVDAGAGTETIDSGAVTVSLGDEDDTAGGAILSTTELSAGAPTSTEPADGGTSGSSAADPTGPLDESDGTGFSPFPSPPPEGVQTTLFPVEFAMRMPWDDGEEIPRVYTCDGRGSRSPLVAWFPPPRRTVELALVAVDEDADGFVHWVATGIEPALGALAPDAQVGGLVEGENGFGDVGWGPPCPPRRDDEHTYRFTLYAAAERFDVDEGGSAEEMIAEIEDTAFRSVSVTGVYDR